MARDSNCGLVVIPDAFTELHLAEVVELTKRHRIAAVNWSRSFAAGGGLISYGPYLVDEHRRAAAYVDRILKGEQPSQLPVQAPLKYELAINLKTAKALALSVPQTLLVAADDLIE
jgi:putative ABC transport system substrate-binding protein